MEIVLETEVPVFVYGTLKKGFRNHGFMAKMGRFLGKAVLNGYEMYRVSDYPGIVPGRKGKINGEVYSVKTEFLKDLDEFEGVAEYLRTKANVRLEDKKHVPVYTYAWVRGVAGKEKIAGGKWTLEMDTAGLINSAEAAEILGTSRASIRNWRRHGYLRPVDEGGKYFSTGEVLQLKKDIDTGKIDRLKSRANKVGSQKYLIPTEYIKNEKNRRQIGSFLEMSAKSGLDRRIIVFILALNLFRVNGDLAFDCNSLLKKNNGGPKFKGLKQLFNLSRENFYRRAVWFEINEFLREIVRETGKNALIREIYAHQEIVDTLFNCELPSEPDILGIIYQSLLYEGKKARLGSYFTPPAIVREIVKSAVRPEDKVLDPCCGTGQFLLCFTEAISDPQKIVGFDIDPTAVRISRINLLLRLSEDFRPRVYHLDTLKDLNSNSGLRAMYGEFDVVATNPPWGAKFSKDKLSALKTDFPDIVSGESFAYFIRTGLALLKDGGTLSFVLPEAILYVRAHAGIRKFILENCSLKKIKWLGKSFNKVLSPVILLELQKRKPSAGEEIMIELPDRQYTLARKRFINNKWFVFDIFLNKTDEEIIGKVFQTRHITLQGNADWALGIVTGDNKRYLKTKVEKRLEQNGADLRENPESNPESIEEPIYKGSDVGHFILNKPQNIIRLSWANFQQVAQEEKYRAKEKLIYRFISDSPIMAYDTCGYLTLNSANILIPRLDYPVKAILALFNSSLYAYIYQKKFHSLKILRGDLEQLPLPLWDQAVIGHIVLLTDKILQGEGSREELDLYIMEQYGLSRQEIEYVLSE